ncbi:hypothetical protein O6R08_07835 [Cutibacterium equinum]|uniref:Tat pathway signal sequence domain protein n=1 Tax=Cutibacterium equinum TaxID=3016342 RepID=A0ABY7QXJ4_9ACTN|nr:hypothetical protein [Cutibacterium equinum]WCC79425.1 hypothetical protein O6R08_07835 [Cutibacterium equinum]
MKTTYTDAMRRALSAVIAAFLLTFLGALVPAVPAHANNDEHITDYTVRATFDRDGDARVSLDFTYDFADED